MNTSTSLITALLFGVTPMTTAQTAMQMWQQNCLMCHGANGSGGSASSLLDDEWEIGASYRDQFNAIKNGVPELGMVAFGDAFTDAEIWALTNLIQEFRERERRQAEPAPRRNREGVIESDHHAYKIETVVAPGPLEIPWSIAPLPGKQDTYIVADRPGVLRLLRDGELSRPVRGLPRVHARGQGGLLDVAPHPDFAENRQIYISYSHRNSRGSITRIVRGTLDERDRFTNEQVIWEARPEHHTSAGVHFGCRLVFEGDYLFFTVGDRGNASGAQRLDTPNGKVHRVYLDGSIPDDNPFTKIDDAYRSIWSFGHRNQQGLAFDLDGRLWGTEHGPRGGDELNLIEPAKNYGWPVVSYGINYNGMPLRQPWPDLLQSDEIPETEITMPAFVWLPSTASCGLDTIRGDAFPEWSGDLIAGGLAGQILERMRIDDDDRVIEREEIIRDMGRIRDVVTDQDGTILVVLNGPDMIIRLVPKD
ncbi:MAG: PQQ-dependent sugar dehydrogenase [Planctomycetota bacterium]